MIRFLQTVLLSWWCVFGVMHATAPAVQPPAAPAADLLNPSKPPMSFEAAFKKAMAMAQERLKSLQAMVQQLPSELDKQKVTYAGSSAFTIKGTDPKAPKATLTLGIDFGDAGHGAMAPFDGAEVNLGIASIPAMVRPPFETAIKRLLFKCREVPDPKFIDPKTGVSTRMITKTTPAVECALKIVLLARDYDAKRITFKTLRNELVALMIRLALVPDIKSFADVMKQLPGPLTAVAGKIKVGKKSLLDFLNTFWKSVVYVVRFDFNTMPDTVLTNKDMAEIARLFAAVICNFVVTYERDMKIFIATPAGKTAYENLQKNNKRADFNKVFPAYNKMVKDTGLRSVAVAQRFKAYRKMRAVLVKKLGEVLDPQLVPYGMTVEMFFPDPDAVTYDEEINFDLMEEMPNFDEDPMFGDNPDAMGADPFAADPFADQQPADEGSGEEGATGDEGTVTLDAPSATDDVATATDDGSVPADDAGNVDATAAPADSGGSDTSQTDTTQAPADGGGEVAGDASAPADNGA